MASREKKSYGSKGVRGNTGGVSRDRPGSAASSGNVNVGIGVEGSPTAAPKVGGRRKRVSLTKKRRGIRTGYEAALNKLTGPQG